jgi:hypothetical protein
MPEHLSSSSTWAAARGTFAQAATWFVTSVALVGDRWDRPGLGEWDVRALVGHTSRSLVTVEEYLARPAAAVDVPTTTAYYLATHDRAAGAEVAERGRAAGEALGAHPATAVGALAARVLPVVQSCDGTELVTTIAGGMRLSDYLPTRTFELVVHTLDLHAALRTAHALAAPPADPASAALALAADLAVAGGTAGDALLALTGRRGLPRGFTVL